MKYSPRLASPSKNLITQRSFLENPSQISENFSNKLRSDLPDNWNILGATFNLFGLEKIKKYKKCRKKLKTDPLINNKTDQFSYFKQTTINYEKDLRFLIKCTYSGLEEDNERQIVNDLSGSNSSLSSAVCELDGKFHGDDPHMEIKPYEIGAQEIMNFNQKASQPKISTEVLMEAKSSIFFDDENKGDSAILGKVFSKNLELIQKLTKEDKLLIKFIYLIGAFLSRSYFFLGVGSQSKAILLFFFNGASNAVIGPLLRKPILTNFPSHANFSLDDLIIPALTEGTELKICYMSETYKLRYVSFFLRNIQSS